MRRWTRLLVATLALVGALAWAGGPVVSSAWAHAGLAESVPAEDSRVDQTPASIVLTFEEAPDPSLTRIALVDEQGDKVPGVSEPKTVPGKPEALQVRLSQSLPKGVYSVNWHVVSAVDGHVQDGAYAFGVGVTPPPGSEKQVDLLVTSRFAQGMGVAGRWLLYAGLVLLVGAASTCLLVFKGRLPSGGVMMSRIALLAAVAGLALMVWSERDLVGARSLLPLFETPEGQQLLYQGIALAICAAAVIAVDLYPGRTTLSVLGAATVAAMLVHCIGGHADAPSSWRVLNIAVQWVHMSAIGVWVGGLAWLLLGIRGQDKPERAAAVAAFSRIATVTLAVVLATGLMRGLKEVGSFGALFDTTYGITLLAKLGLVIVLVALGALNHFRWVPALHSKDGAARSFRLNSTGELALAAGVLLATAMLTGLAPAASAVAASAAEEGAAGRGPAPNRLSAPALGSGDGARPAAVQAVRIVDTGAAPAPEG